MSLVPGDPAYPDILNVPFLQWERKGQARSLQVWGFLLHLNSISHPWGMEEEEQRSRKLKHLLLAI